MNLLLWSCEVLLTRIPSERGAGAEEAGGGTTKLLSLISIAAWPCCSSVSRIEPPVEGESDISMDISAHIVRANAILAWASAGGANAVISTWRSSWRCWYFGSWEARNSSSCLQLFAMREYQNYGRNRNRNNSKLQVKFLNSCYNMMRKKLLCVCPSWMEPVHRTAICVIVCSWSLFMKFPFGPSSLPTKLNWNNSI